MKGVNKCGWLIISSTELCGRRCMGEHCSIHNVQLRKGSCTKPCRQCGKGVTNYLTLCKGCGYTNENTKLWQRRHRALLYEFRRLALIEVI